MKMFRKLIAFVVSVSMMGSLSSSINVIHADGLNDWYTCGDINNSGGVDVTDLSLLNMFLNGDNTSAHDRMTERLDVNNDNIIDYKDVSLIRSYVTQQQIPDLRTYTNYSDLIEEANGLYYTKVILSGNTISSSNYWLRGANAISETTSSLQPLNMENTLNTTSVSDNNGIVKLTVSIGNETIVGTGFVVDNNTILTTASNLCRNINNTWVYASEITCDIYTISGVCVYSGYSADSYHIPVNYASTTTDNSKYNYAAVKLGENINLSNYKMKLGVPTTSFNQSVKTTSVAVSSGSTNNTYTRTHSLYGQKVNGGFINYTAGFGEASGQYGAPVYIEDENSQISVLGIASKYVDGFTDFNRAVRIDQDIYRFIYGNSLL